MAFLEYFQSAYQKEVDYLKQKQKMAPFIKLHNQSESIDSKVLRLIQAHVKSNLHISTGKFNESGNI